MPTWTNDSKTNTSPTWKRYTRRGTTPTLGDLGDFIFTDPVEEDSDPTMGDATISSFAASSVTWTNDNKSTSPTWTNENQT